LNAYRDCGALAVYAACTPENVTPTLEVVGAQLKRLKSGDLRDVRLEDIKAQIKGNLLLARESSVNRMSSMAKNEIYYGREVGVEEVIEKIQAVGMDDVVALADEIFREERLIFVSLGRLSEDELPWPLFS
ncbi:MAG TPA: insulinase family protein, partial [Deltaproteobacteria bacterium]|nr:insulinase family protein [Deltaproteobacteria bacterium]